MITRELIKSEIDQVRDEYLEPLFRIIKVFEKPAEVHPETNIQPEWNEFIHKFAGCLADDPIKRGEQGQYETREEII